MIIFHGDPTTPHVPSAKNLGVASMIDAYDISRPTSPVAPLLGYYTIIIIVVIITIIISSSLSSCYYYYYYYYFFFAFHSPRDLDIAIDVSLMSGWSGLVVCGGKSAFKCDQIEALDAN